MLTDYHVHLERGDFSLDYLKQFIEWAHERGIGELGISEHAYRFKQTSNILMNDWVAERKVEDMDEYVDLFDRARRKGYSVKMGIEMDYTPGKEKEMEAFINRYPFDYIIGSVHWIGDWGIDLFEFRDEYERRDIKDVYKAYYDQIVTLAESRLFDIVGHIDLIKIFKYKPDDETFIEAQYDRAVEALAKSGTSIEISTAGLRKPVGELYPDRVLLQKCYDAGITIVLSSDAHQPNHVGIDYDQSLQLARSIGYTDVQVFTQRKKQSMPLG